MITFVQKVLRRLGLERKVIIPLRIPVLKSDLLKGRRALITGGGRGIGRAIAKAFLSSGCEVVITGRNEAKLQETVAALRIIGPRVGYVLLDNARVESFHDAIGGLIIQYGDFDILVNNAGITKGGEFGSSTVEGFDTVFNSILKGAWFLSQEISKRWCQKKIQGNILNICSTSSLRPGYSPYTMCKNAERAMTVGLAKRLIPFGIVVNGIGPGITSVERLVPNADVDIAHPGNPSGRYVTEEEIADMAVVLVSDMGRMVVGDIVYMGGGAGIITVDDE